MGRRDGDEVILFCVECVRGMFGERGAIKPSDVSLREGRDRNLGILPSKEKIDSMDLIKETREGCMWVEDPEVGEVGSTS